VCDAVKQRVSADGTAPLRYGGAAPERVLAPTVKCAVRRCSAILNGSFAARICDDPATAFGRIATVFRIAISFPSYAQASVCSGNNGAEGINF
jgi:hypothetical protein